MSRTESLDTLVGSSTGHVLRTLVGMRMVRVAGEGSCVFNRSQLPLAQSMSFDSQRKMADCPSLQWADEPHVVAAALALRAQFKIYSVAVSAEPGFDPNSVRCFGTEGPDGLEFSLVYWCRDFAGYSFIFFNPAKRSRTKTTTVW